MPDMNNLCSTFPALHSANYHRAEQALANSFLHCDSCQVYQAQESRKSLASARPRWSTETGAECMLISWHRHFMTFHDILAALLPLHFLQQDRPKDHSGGVLCTSIWIVGRIGKAAALEVIDLILNLLICSDQITDHCALTFWHVESSLSLSDRKVCTKVYRYFLS